MWSYRVNLDTPDLSYGSCRYIRKERAESFRYRRVDENGVSELGIWQVGQHRRLHRSQNLAGVGANHREAENPFVASIDKNLHEALCFVRCLCPQYSATLRRENRAILSDAEAGPQRSQEAEKSLKGKRTFVTLQPIPSGRGKGLEAPSLLVASVMPGHSANASGTASRH